MTIEETIFHVTDEAGVKILISESDLKILNNGKDKGLKLADLFPEITDIKSGSVAGNSLLGYFSVVDGALQDKEGNTVQFVSPDGKKILFTKITSPLSTYGDIEVSAEYVKAFSDVIGIQKPEELFTDLSRSESSFLIIEREKKEQVQVKNENKKAKEIGDKYNSAVIKGDEAFTAEDYTTAKEHYTEASNLKPEEEYPKQKLLEIENKLAEIESANKEELSRQEKLKEDTANSLKRKKDTDVQFVNDDTDYINLRNYYAGDGTEKNKGAGFKEYNIDGKYIFFYGQPDPNAKNQPEPFLLIKRLGDWYEEPEEAEVLSEDDNKVEYGFLDIDTQKKIVLDLKNNTAVIEESGVEQQ